MKTFTMPKVEIILLDAEKDVIVTSGCGFCETESPISCPPEF